MESFAWWRLSQMAEGFVQLPPDSTGKMVRSFSGTVGVNTVYQQGFVLCDANSNIIDTIAAAPAGTERGLAVRQIGATALPTGAATEGTVANRYSGGKLAKTISTTLVGDTTIHTPAAGKAIRLFWISALNDPDQSVSPKITIKFTGATNNLYATYGLAHWEIFTGPVDTPLLVNLDQAGDVAVTIHYQEI